MARRQLILVLDRDRETLDVALAAVDYCPAIDVVLARDVADAGVRLEGRVPDLAIVDALTARLAGDRALAELLPAGEPVLLLASVENLERLPQPLLERASDVLVKPLRTSEARFRIARLLAPEGDLEERVGAFDLRATDPGRGAIAGSPGESPSRPSDPRFAGASAWTALLGDSEPIREVRRQLELLAPSSDCVLLVGEPGSRREVVAQALHSRGGRAGRPFVVIGAERLAAPVPPAPDEGEIRTSAAGAPGTPVWTHAERDAEALLAEAAGGTLFVPELSELDLPSQERLLALVEEIERAATTAAARTAAHTGVARLIASTRTPLAHLVQEGAFREDLFYKLHAHPVRVPSLRERGRDVLLLAQHLTTRAAAALGRPAPILTAEAQAELLAHDWPGNLRELETCIIRAVHVGHDHLGAEHLELSPAAAGPLLPFRDAKRDVVDCFERSYAVRALALAKGNISAAARLAGKDRKDFWTILRKHGIAITRRGRNPESELVAGTCNPQGQDDGDAPSGEDSRRGFTPPPGRPDDPGR